MEALTDPEIRRLIAACRFGYLGLADEGRAYVVPLYYGFKGGAFYFHSDPGLKDHFIGRTEEACLVINQVQSDDAWISVMAFGKLEDVRDAPDQLRGMEALMSVPMPPALGQTETGRPARSERPSRLYKLVPARMTGRRSLPPPATRSEREMALRGM